MDVLMKFKKFILGPGDTSKTPQQQQQQQQAYQEINNFTR